MKNNKITVEEQDTNKLGKLWSERRFVEENGWQYYVYYQANKQMRYSRKNPNREGKRGEGQRNSTQNFQGLITSGVDFPRVIKKKTRTNAIGIDINDFATTTQVHVAVNTFQCS